MTVLETSRESTSRFVTAGDIRLHYHDAGSGDVVMLLHVGGPGADGWNTYSRNIPALARRFRTLVPDLPGFGQSDKPLVSPDGLLAVAARAVNDMLDALQLDRVSVVGDSLGAGVAFFLALRYPHRVERLVLTGPLGASLPLVSPHPSEGNRVISTFYAPPGPSVEKMREVLRVMVHDPAVIDEDLVLQRYASAVTPDVMAFRKNLTRAGGPPRVEEVWREADRVEHPTLLLWGRDDRVAPLDGALFLLKRMPNARLYVLPRCGTWPHVEHAEEFNRIVAGFLSLPSRDVPKASAGE